MATASGQKLTIVSNDGERFLVDVAVAQKSRLLKYAIEDVGTKGEYPLPNVRGKIFAKVLEYCQRHAEHKAGDYKEEEALKKWEAEFVKVDLHDTMFDLIDAANYLDIKSLLDLTCRTVAEAIKGKTTEEIRKLLRIKNDFTPEEEEQVRREYQWALDMNSSSTE